MPLDKCPGSVNITAASKHPDQPPDARSIQETQEEGLPVTSHHRVFYHR